MKTDGLNHGDLVEDILESNKYEPDRIWLIINDTAHTIRKTSTMMYNSQSLGFFDNTQRRTNIIVDQGKLLCAALEAYKIAALQ